MKQLQWDKLPQQQVGKTVFNDDEPTKEQEWVKKLQMENVWMEMEEDFKAKQLVINLMGRSLPAAEPLDQRLMGCMQPNRRELT